MVRALDSRSGGGGGMGLSSGPALDATAIDNSRNIIIYYNALCLSLQNIVQTLSSVSPGR